jgi:hypothetical protein
MLFAAKLAEDGYMRNSTFVAYLFIVAFSVTLVRCTDPQPTSGIPTITSLVDAAAKSKKECPTMACIYVTNSAGAGSITVYPSDATGNITPFRTITDLTNPYGLAVDSQGKIHASFASCFVSTCIESPSILVFSPTANGKAQPLYQILGPATELHYTLAIAVDDHGNTYARNVTISEKHCGPSGCLTRAQISEYAAGARGNAAPLRVVRGTKTGLFNQDGGIAVDGQGTMYVTTTPSCWDTRCKGKAAVLAYAKRVSGNSQPSWSISGPATQLSYPEGVAIDDDGNVYVADASSIFVYAAGQHGNVAPVQTIAGSNTGLDEPLSVSVDAAKQIYVANGAYPGSVTVYASGATGDVKPIQTIAGKATGLSLPYGLAVH